MTGVIRHEQAAPVVWMFSGQGVQYFQMGRTLYERNATFRSWMDKLDRVAAEYAGQSIVETLYDDARPKSQVFDQILYTHPALFMVQYAMAKTLLAEGFPPPDYLFGASLGEFVAAALAGVADPETMLFDLIRQARLFDAHCGGGAMLLVIDDVDTFHTDPVFSSGCELAGVNFDGCFAVSGLRSDIHRIAEQLKQRDVTYQVLPVTIAFHSSLMDGVEEKFNSTFSSKTYRPAAIPIVSCAVSAGAQDFSAAYWWRVIRQPIQFRQALGEFQRKHPHAMYLDAGPSGNMATFTKYNSPASAHHKIIPVMMPFGSDDESIETARRKLAALVVRNTSMGSHDDT